MGGEGERDATGSSVLEVKDAVQHSTMCMAALTTKNYVDENVHSANVEKSCPGPGLTVLVQVTLRLIHTL